MRAVWWEQTRLVFEERLGAGKVVSGRGEGDACQGSCGGDEADRGELVVKALRVLGPGVGDQGDCVRGDPHPPCS